MRDPKSLMDDFFAMEIIHGDLDKKEKEEQNASEAQENQYSGGTQNASSSSSGCLGMILLFPVLPAFMILKRLFF